MQDINSSKINPSEILSARKVFFVGIGGIGISAIARMFFLDGKEVSGSDMSESEITRELSDLGIKVFIIIILFWFIKHFYLCRRDDS